MFHISLSSPTISWHASTSAHHLTSHPTCHSDTWTTASAIALSLPSLHPAWIESIPKQTDNRSDPSLHFGLQKSRPIRILPRLCGIDICSDIEDASSPHPSPPAPPPRNKAAQTASTCLEVLSPIISYRRAITSAPLSRKNRNNPALA